MGVNLRINESGRVEVVKLGSADPFSAPAAPELSLNPFRPGEPFLHRQRLSGIVTLYRPGEYFYAQAAQRAFRIETRQTEPLNLGDVVEVSGFMRKSEGYARLTEAVFRRTGSADLPPAFATTASKLKRSDSPTTELRVEDHDGRIIRVQGSLLKLDRDEQQQPRLYFEHEGKVRLALMSPETPEPELRALGPGSEVELTGICVQHLDLNWPSVAMPSAVDFHLLLRDMRDIAVMRAPSWWTPQRLVWALGWVLSAFMLILAWNILIAEARNVEEAINLYRQHLPDVVTMDYELPDGVGPDAVVRIRAEFPGARVLLLSAHEGEEQVHRAVEAGVCGYLPKRSECATVLDAIRALHGGRSVFPPDILQKAASRRGRDTLSDREIKILTLLSRGNCNKLIAAGLGDSESLIKQELVRIFDKLGAKDRAHAVMLALERGLVR